MIKLNIDNNKISYDSINILNATVITALPDGFPIDSENIEWSLDNTIDRHIPVITGKYGTETFIKPRYVIHIPDGTIQLTGMIINSTALVSPVHFKVTPMNEIYILGKIESKEPEKRQVHSQLSACSKLIQEMYSDIPGYNVEESQIPKVFFTKLDLDFYLANLAVTLEESILLWMESTGKLSVNMNDEAINMPRILEKSIKRVFMFGPARNKVKVEFNNGDQKDFSLMTPSAQVEICSEILSILPE